MFFARLEARRNPNLLMGHFICRLPTWVRWFWSVNTSGKRPGKSPNVRHNRKSCPTRPTNQFICSSYLLSIPLSIFFVGFGACVCQVDQSVIARKFSINSQ